MPLFQKSRFTVDIPVECNGEEAIALYQTMTGAFILIPEEAWSEIAKSGAASCDSETVEMLYEQGFLVREGTDETAVFDYWKQQHVHDFSTLKSKILVTRKCNNRCRYCILDPEAIEMSPETALVVDRLYIDMVKEKRPLIVKDDYLGGEPLLNSGVILESAGRRFYYCRGEGIDYGFIMTTNGTLLMPSIISEMKEVGLAGIHVSMAGPRDVHDHLRPLKNNGPTYDLIMENLRSVSGLVPITIECQYDSGAKDYERMPELFDDFEGRGIVIKHMHFTPILPRRGESPYQCGMGDPHIALSLMKEAQKRGYLQDREPPSQACMADFRSQLVIDTDGSIIPCPALQGGEMAYGHVNKGFDFVLEAQLRKRRLPDKCLNECALLPICMGGCRLQALVHQGDFAGIDCRYDTYRLFLEDYIREQAAAALADRYFVR